MDKINKEVIRRIMAGEDIIERHNLPTGDLTQLQRVEGQQKAARLMQLTAKESVQDFINREAETPTKCWKLQKDPADTCTFLATRSAYSKTKRIDVQMLRAHGMCMDCATAMATELKLNGQWEEYIFKKQMDQRVGQLQDDLDQLDEFLVKVYDNPHAQILLETGAFETFNADVGQIVSGIEAFLNEATEFAEANNLEFYNERKEHIDEQLHKIRQKYNLLGEGESKEINNFDTRVNDILNSATNVSESGIILGTSKK